MKYHSRFESLEELLSNIELLDSNIKKRLEVDFKKYIEEEGVKEKPETNNPADQKYNILILAIYNLLQSG